jgi:hypothetical protein
MSWHFWLIPIFFFWFFGMRRRFGDLPRHRRRKLARTEAGTAPDPELAAEVETQRSYISDLEARVAELENRLDFTERLLATRHQTESTAT